MQSERDRERKMDVRDTEHVLCSVKETISRFERTEYGILYVYEHEYLCVLGVG